MSVQRLVLQTAPVPDGQLDEPNHLVWTGTSEMFVHGVLGRAETASWTFVFPASNETVGAGSIEVAWTWSTDPLETGVFNIGAGYTAGTVIHLTDGIGVSFSAGTTKTSNIITVGGTIPRRSLLGHRQLVAGTYPVDLLLNGMGFEDRDIRRMTSDARQRRTRISRARTIDLGVKWMDGDASTVLDEIESGRRLVTLNENYGPHTIFLYRPGLDLEPFIGTMSTLSTAVGHRVSQDPDTHLFVRHDAGDVGATKPRLVPGPEFASSLVSLDKDRHQIPSDYQHVGRGLAINGQVMQNKMPKSHPREADLNLATWKGSPATPVWDTSMRGVYDPRSSFWQEYTNGVARCELPDNSSDGIRGGSTYATVSDNTRVIGEVWVKVRGVLRVCLLTGASTPSTVAASATVRGTGDRWMRIVLEDDSVASGHSACSFGFDGGIGGSGGTEFFVSHQQIEQNAAQDAIGVSMPIECRTAATSSSSADLFVPGAAMTPSGTFMFWWCHPYDDGASLINIFDSVDVVGDGMELLRDCTTGSEEWVWYMQNTNPMTATGIEDLKPGQWVHLALTWDMEDPGGAGTASQLRMRLYEQGAQIGVKLLTSPDVNWGRMKFCGTGRSDKTPNGVAISDIRIDSVALSAEEIARAYNLYAADDAREAFVKTAGRLFDIEQNTTKPIFAGSPGRNEGRVRLVEVDRHDNSLLRAP